jgi:L-alanine-DL-glutamate epimerase-like enolase superfamily enzyme
VVDGVTATDYQVPTDQPEADGTLAWSSTTLVIAHVAGGGQAGLGYTYGSGACKALIEGELAAAVAGRDALDASAALEAMARAARNLGRPGLASCAMLFDGALDPAGGALRPDRSRPGLGLALKEANAAPYRTA